MKWELFYLGLKVQLSFLENNHLHVDATCFFFLITFFFCVRSQILVITQNGANSTQDIYKCAIGSRTIVEQMKKQFLP